MELARLHHGGGGEGQSGRGGGKNKKDATEVAEVAEVAEVEEVEEVEEETEVLLSPSGGGGGRGGGGGSGGHRPGQSQSKSLLARLASSNALTHCSLVLAQLNWALMHIVIAPALRSGTNPLVLSISREFLATLILAAYARWVHGGAGGGGAGRGGGGGGGGGRNPGGGGMWSWDLIRAGGSLGFAMAIMRSSVVVANYYAGPDITATLVLTSPVFTFLFSAVAGVEPIDPRRRSVRLQIVGVCGCVLAAVAMGASGDSRTRGALLFGIPTGTHVPRDAALGTFFMLLNTCASSAQVVWQRQLIDAGFSPERLNAVMTGIATAWLAPPALALAHDLNDWKPTFPLVGAATYAAVFPAAMNVAMMARANRILGPRITMLYFVLQPLMTWIADYVFLEDAVYATQAVSAALALAALTVWLIGKNAEGRE